MGASESWLPRQRRPEAHTVHYKWLKDPDYQIAFAHAREEAIGVLESEAYKGAREGVETPVIWRGHLCFEPLRDPKTNAVLHDRRGKPLLSRAPLTINRKSDAMLMFVPKTLDPKYRENAPVQPAGGRQRTVADRGGVSGLGQAVNPPWRGRVLVTWFCTGRRFILRTNPF
jgi:hypothetical protein